MIKTEGCTYNNKSCDSPKKLRKLAINGARRREIGPVVVSGEK